MEDTGTYIDTQNRYYRLSFTVNFCTKVFWAEALIRNPDVLIYALSFIVWYAYFAIIIAILYKIVYQQKIQKDCGPGLKGEWYFFATPQNDIEKGTRPITYIKIAKVGRIVEIVRLKPFIIRHVH